MRKSRSLLELLLLIAVVACGMAVLQEKTQTPNQAVLARSPAEIALSQAIQAYRKGQFALCRERCDEVFKTAPEDLIAMRYKGMALAGEGKLGEAKAEFTRGIDSVQNPVARTLYASRVGRLYLERARLEVAQKDYAAAEQDAQTLTSEGDNLLATNVDLMAEGYAAMSLAQAGQKKYQPALNSNAMARLTSVIPREYSVGNLAKRAILQSEPTPAPADPILEKHRLILERLVDGHDGTPIPTVTHPGFCPLCSHKF